MTEQEIFDTVATHLRKQGRKAIETRVGIDGEGTFCRYRAADGTKCAAGCLITDEEYDPSMEGRLAGLILPKRLEPFSLLISQLQEIHDGLDPAEWEDGLARLARRLELKYSRAS